MSNSNHTTYVTTYVTTYTYLYISMQIIKYKYINVTTFAPSFTPSHIPLLRRRRCRWCRFCGWRRSRPAHPRPGRRNFISQNQWNLFILCTTLKVFLFSFLCFFESKENHFVLMQFHVFIWRISWFQFVKRFRQRKTKRLRPDEICTQLFIQKNHQKVHPFFISLSNVKHIFCIHSYILTSFYTDSNAINAIDKN